MSGIPTGMCMNDYNDMVTYQNRCHVVCTTVSASTLCTGDTDPTLYPPHCWHTCEAPDGVPDACPLCTVHCDTVVPSDCKVEVQEPQCSWVCDAPLAGFTCSPVACGYDSPTLDLTSSSSTVFVDTSGAAGSSESALTTATIVLGVLLALSVLFLLWSWAPA
jgi:hypothetical protein